MSTLDRMQHQTDTREPKRKVPMKITVPREDKTWMEQRAEKTGESAASIARAAIRQFREVSERMQVLT